MPRRLWDGHEWQSYSRRLVQVRHSAENVQDVPDKVQGDAGLEFFTVDGCCYQSYAPQEVVDVAKATSAIKSKGARDLRKLKSNRKIIAGLLGEIKIRRWILLTPFLDDKDVIRFLQDVGKEIVSEGLPFVSEDFCTLSQSLTDFETEVARLRALSSGPLISSSAPSSEELEDKTTELDERIHGKLKRAFPSDDAVKLASRKRAHVEAYIRRENVLSDLREYYPDFWEASMNCINDEERRLEMSGSTGVPSVQISSSIDRVEASLKDYVPALTRQQVSTIASGTVGTWLIECPLDFEEPE